MLGIRSSRTSDIVRIAASTGHTAIMVDLEHSAMSIDEATAMCATAGALGLTALARVPEFEYGVIGRLLDGGADGIVVARVESADQIQRISEAVRFPPLGHRSQLAMVPQLGMKPTPANVLNRALDARAILKILIESPLGVENAEAIAAVPGVDIVGIGANDLTAELGIPGQYDSPIFREAVEAVAAAAKKANKPLMLGGVGDLSIVKSMLPLGVAPFYLTGMDSDLLFVEAASRITRFSDWHKTVYEGTNSHGS
ncbi:MAG TPA: aldolase/citrate lyase family protein [Galbitalea sp.]|nr:aldolase/citrate lyase family protein [Galbitalea sp.]